MLILKLLDLYDHSTWETRWWRESFHLFILAILSVSSTLHSTTTHSHIDWPLSSSRVELHDGLWQKRKEEELCRCVRWRQSQRSPVRDDIYIVFHAVKSGEILFAARDEKAVSFRWSPLITHPVCVCVVWLPLLLSWKPACSLGGSMFQYTAMTSV
jgi:hypothetical protein